MSVPNPAPTHDPAELSGTKPVRIHYLDWLRVLAIFGVFLFHTVRPFVPIAWAISNAEKSLAALLFIIFFAPWGMPLFFFLSGAGTCLALRRRTGRQYAVERIRRLVIPFIVGCLLLTPIQLYIQWLHQTQAGAFAGSPWELFWSRRVEFGPKVFGWVGYHLWFLGFLFAFSLFALPLFLWLRKDAGHRIVAWLAGLSERRGGLLLFIIPLVLIQILLHPRFPAYQGWTDFVYMLTVFICGYILYADERFIAAVRRDWPIASAGVALSSLFIIVGAAKGPILGWMDSTGTPGFYLFWTVYGINTWCWALFILHIGRRYLDFTNRWLERGREMILPFYFFHHPTIFAIAFFVVRWDAAITLKLPAVAIGSLAVTLALVGLIRRIPVLRGLLGVKSRPN